MQARSFLPYLAASLLTVAALFPITLRASELPVLPLTELNLLAPATCPVPTNALETHEFHIRNARIPNLQSARQNVTAWQVDQGTWNGQTLSGLTVVLVQSLSEGGAPAHLTNCYVSLEATPAQRTALVDAFLASNTQVIASQELNAMRIEPAAIQLEIAGETFILHLGLIA